MCENTIHQHTEQQMKNQTTPEQTQPSEKTVSTRIRVGEINTLKIMRDTDFGFFLESQDGDEVLLPNAYIIESQMPMGSLLDVFVYTDSEDRPVATTRLPYAKLGEYGYFTVVDDKKYGSFVNWGLPKDLFVPLSQQKEIFQIGKKYILRVCIDAQTGRLYGTQKIGKFFNRNMKGLYTCKKLDAIVIAKTPLGYKVVADNQYEGMLFNNEIYSDLNIGDRREVYIKNVRPDFKLDLSLQPIGIKAKIDDAQGAILQRLKEAGGTLPFTYKSDAEDIKKVFSMSKKNFKRTLTTLLERKEVLLLDDSIKLL